MTRGITLFCLAMVLAFARPALAQDVKSDQDTLIELEMMWDEAFHSQDAAFIETILAPEFLATYGDGTRGDRDKELALVHEQNQQIDSSHLENFRIEVFRDTAVVWFTQVLVGPVQGVPTEVQYQYMDVWVIRDGKWLCVGSQSTRVGSRGNKQ